MSEKEEAFKNEFRFASSSIVAHIVRGVLVGIVVGCVVSSFRFLIEHIFHFVDRKSTRLNSSHIQKSRMPSSA